MQAALKAVSMISPEQPYITAQLFDDAMRSLVSIPTKYIKCSRLVLKVTESIILGYLYVAVFLPLLLHSNQLLDIFSMLLY